MSRVICMAIISHQENFILKQMYVNIEENNIVKIYEARLLYLQHNFCT